MSHVSASQVKSFLRCPRKWAYDKIDKIPRVDRPATQLGGRVHSILEEWSKNGTLPDLDEKFTYTARGGATVDRYPGRIAHAGLHLLPPPGTGEVEREFRFRSPGGLWLGYVDLRYTSEDGTPIIHDHKTTGSPQYAHTAETLRHDPQAVLYAGVEMDRTGSHAVRLDWAYFPTRLKPRPWLVSLRVSREDIEPDLARLDKAAGIMNRALKSGITAKETPHNPAACGDYGGCEYSKFCPRSPVDFFSEKEITMTESPTAENAMAQLAALLTAPAAPAPPAPPAPPAAPAPPAPPADEINPPEAPPPTKEQPAAAPLPKIDMPAIPAGGLAEMTRADLKTLAIAKGLVDSSSRLGKDRLVDLLSGKQTQKSPTVEDPYPAVVTEDPPESLPTMSQSLAKARDDFWERVLFSAIEARHIDPVMIADQATKAKFSA